MCFSTITTKVEWLQIRLQFFGPWQFLNCVNHKRYWYQLIVNSDTVFKFLRCKCRALEILASIYSKIKMTHVMNSYMHIYNYDPYIFNEAQAIRISQKRWFKNCWNFLCEVFTLSVINVQKIIMGYGYCSDLGTIPKPDTISARFCMGYIVKYLSKVSFVRIKIKLRNNFFFHF
jgi:hypothetical protein